MAHKVIKVLVVEDVALAAKMTEITLEDLGCEVTIAKTGAEAIAQFKKQQFDLIFMDLGLPNVDGITVAERIRELEKSTGRVPIIALTAHTGDEYRQNVLRTTNRLGEEKTPVVRMNDFLSKPLTKDKAQNVIDRYVNTQQERRILKTTSS